MIRIPSTASTHGSAHPSSELRHFLVEETAPTAPPPAVESNQGADAGLAAGETIERVRFQLLRRIRTAARHTDRLVRTHPYETVAVGLGAGLLLGWLLSRSDHSTRE